MEITIDSNETRHIITLDGRVDAFQVPALRKHIETFADHANQNYIVDLSTVDFLDSAGMAVLVKLLKQARTQSGEVVLIWSQHQEANRILTLTRFDKVFNMADDMDGAINHLEG